MKYLRKELIIKNSCPVSMRDKFMPPSGVYFLIDDGEIVYIGKSQMIRVRLFDHLREKKFDSVFFIACDDEDALLMIERKYIDHFQPVLNIAGIRGRVRELPQNGTAPVGKPGRH